MWEYLPRVIPTKQLVITVDEDYYGLWDEFEDDPNICGCGCPESVLTVELIKASDTAAGYEKLQVTASKGCNDEDKNVNINVYQGLLDT